MEPADFLDETLDKRDMYGYSMWNAVKMYCLPSLKNKKE